MMPCSTTGTAVCATIPKRFGWSETFTCSLACSVEYFALSFSRSLCYFGANRSIFKIALASQKNTRDSFCNSMQFTHTPLTPECRCQPGQGDALHAPHVCLHATTTTTTQNRAASRSPCVCSPEHVLANTKGEHDVI